MNPTAPPLRDWRELTDLTRGVELVVERVRIADSDIAIEGAFALPRLAQLSRPMALTPSTMRKT